MAHLTELTAAAVYGTYCLPGSDLSGYRCPFVYCSVQAHGLGTVITVSCLRKLRCKGYAVRKLRSKPQTWQSGTRAPKTAETATVLALRLHGPAPPTLQLAGGGVELRALAADLDPALCGLFQVEGKTSIILTFRQLMAEEGPWGLMKGLSARIISATPSTIVIVVGYESLKKLSLRPELVDSRHW